MIFPDDFPITNRWPAKDPSVIQLYSLPTPNGVKASLMLEETGLPYEPHLVMLSDDNVKSPEFLSLNPNNKIPAIIDPTAEGGPIGIFESGAILIYLAEKTGMFLSTEPAKRAATLQWLMFQMGGLGPMFGQLGFFTKFAGAEIEDPRPRDRYIAEGKRILNVLNGALEGKEWIVDDYSIADMAIAPWLTALDFYGVKDLLGYEGYENVTAYEQRFLARPKVAIARNTPERPA